MGGGRRRALRLRRSGHRNGAEEQVTGREIMRERILGTLTIGQAPRPDVVPIIDRYVASRVRRIHRGVLDSLSRAGIDARYKPEPREPVLVTRLQDGSTVKLSRARMRDGVQDLVRLLENEG